LIAPEHDVATRATLVGRLTPAGEGGISVVELIGPSAAAVLDPLFVSPRRIRASEMQEGRLAYGHLWRDGVMLDEVLLECVRLGPEPVFAVNCHGGAVALRNVMNGLVAEGAERAGWEQLLDRRRELGLLDAVQCEASLAIPNALTLRAARALLDQYRGALATAIREVRSLLDASKGDAAAENIRTLLVTGTYGTGLVAPPRLVIVGKPNVGKSTLGNALLRHDRFIVHETSGTTRDTVEEHFAVEGVPFLLTDTAGIRASQDEIESEGVRRSHEALAEADVALLVFDASRPLDEEDEKLASGARGGKMVFVLNKSDLAEATGVAEFLKPLGADAVRVSALTGAGLEELERRLLKTACPVLPPPGAPLCFTPRQKALLEESLTELQDGRGEKALGILAGITT
jgi:tRNA modification GTPase